MKPILILKTGQTIAQLLRHGEDFEDWIVRGAQLLPGQFCVTDAYAGAPLPALESLAGIIVTGSPAMVTELAPWSEECGRYMRQAYSQGIPMLGICYGHQLLAHACGGEAGYHPQGREIGTVDVDLFEAAKTDPLFRSLPSRFSGHTTHSQTVLSLPPEAVLLARSAHDPHQAFRLGECAWGVQFHPEFSATHMTGYIQARQDELLEEGLDLDGLLAGVINTPEATSLLQKFVQLATA
ncbi:MAG: glutamine amidotransferase [Gammaproteobacteria bacterium]